MIQNSILVCCILRIFGCKNIGQLHYIETHVVLNSITKGVTLLNLMSWSITRLQLGRKKKQFFILSRQSSIYLEFFLAQVLSCGGDAGATFPFVDRLTRINKSTLGERKEIYTQRTPFSAPQKQKKAAGDILFYIIPRRLFFSLSRLYIARLRG